MIIDQIRVIIYSKRSCTIVFQQSALSSGVKQVILVCSHLLPQGRDSSLGHKKVNHIFLMQRHSFATICIIMKNSCWVWLNVIVYLLLWSHVLSINVISWGSNLFLFVLLGHKDTSLRRDRNSDSLGSSPDTVSVSEHLTSEPGLHQTCSVYLMGNICFIQLLGNIVIIIIFIIWCWRAGDNR